MVHEHHDAPCFDQGVEWSRYAQYQFEMVIVNIMMHLVLTRGLSGRDTQYQFEMVIVRARTVKFNLKIASFACKGA